MQFELTASHTDSAKLKTFMNRYGIHGSKTTSITLEPGENLVKIPTFILLWHMEKQRIHGRYEALARLRFTAQGNAGIALGFGQITIER